MHFQIRPSDLILLLVAISPVTGISGVIWYFKDLGLVLSAPCKVSLLARIGLYLGHLCLLLHDGSIKAPLPKRKDQLVKG